jgi:hypothetical protein
MPEQEIIIEVRRVGRRPRYHRGAQLENGTRLDPPQCNIDDATREVRVLDALPEYPEMRRPWAQLCRRCWAGSPVWEKAKALDEALRHGVPAL